MNFEHLSKDVSASVVVFLIALPLSMGVALASGVPPALGLITAIIGGLTVGVFGGAPLRIAGPSAGLTVLVLQLVHEHGLATLALVSLIAGAIQMAGGLLRIGRQFQAVSPAVIRGMITGIGVLIIASQFHIMVDQEVPGSGLDNLLGIPAAFWTTITNRGSVDHEGAALTGLITLAAIVVWERFRPKKLKSLPGPLIGVALGAGVANGFGLSVRHVEVPENLVHLLSLPTAESLGSALNSDVILAGAALAFVGSAETLLCATAITKMAGGARAKYDRELVVQGAANMLCGVIGTLPMTGVISRSTANVEAGAKTKLASILQAVWIAAFVLLLPQLLSLIPTSALAAVLIHVGIKLVNPAAIQKLAKFGRQVIAIAVVTAAGIVLVDLLSGIVAGLLLSAVRLMYTMSHVEFHVEETEGKRVELHMRGSATFLALPKLSDALEAVPAGSELHFHFDDLEFIDHACLDQLDEFRERHAESGGQVILEWDELFSRRHKEQRLDDWGADGESLMNFSNEAVFTRKDIESAVSAALAKRERTEADSD